MKHTILWNKVTYNLKVSNRFVQEVSEKKAIDEFVVELQGLFLYFRLSVDEFECSVYMKLIFCCCYFSSAGTTGFTLNLGGTTAPTTTASTGLSLGGTLAGLGGSLFQNTSTAATGESWFYFFPFPASKFWDCVIVLNYDQRFTLYKS